METPEQVVNSCQSYIKDTERRHCYCFGVFIVNFEQNSYTILFFSIALFEYVKGG